MDPEYGFKALYEGVGWGPMSRVEEVIVFEPVGEGVVVHHLPRPRPHLLHEFLGLFGGFTCPRQEVDPRRRLAAQRLVYIVIIIIISFYTRLLGQF